MEISFYKHFLDKTIWVSSVAQCGFKSWKVAKSSPTVSASCALCETLADRESPTAVPFLCCWAPDISHLKSVYKMTSDAPQRPLKIKILGLKGEFTQTMTINVYSTSSHSKPVWLFPPWKTKMRCLAECLDMYQDIWNYDIIMLPIRWYRIFTNVM